MTTYLNDFRKQLDKCPINHVTQTVLIYLAEGSPPLKIFEPLRCNIELIKSFSDAGQF